MSAIKVQIFLGRARDLLKGMDFLKDDLMEKRYSAAVLGIHCAMSYSDALRCGMGSAKLSSSDHKTAANDLRSLLSSREFEQKQGADRLEKLLARKSRVEYSTVATRKDEAEDIVKQAERFASWAENAGRQLGIEGW